SQAHHRQSLALRFFKSDNHFSRFFDLDCARLKRLVDHSNLPRMDASHAFESQRPRSFSPSSQTVHVADIAEHRVNPALPPPAPHSPPATAHIATRDLP